MIEVTTNCIVNKAEILKGAKSYEHLEKVDGLLKDVQEIKMFEKRMVSVFLVTQNLSPHERQSDWINVSVGETSKSN